MFSAIFGSFYGRVEETVPAATTEEDITTTTTITSLSSNEVSTQTFDTNKNISSTQAQANPNLDTSNTHINLNDTSNSQQLDWVIVDDSEETTNSTNDKANNVDMMPTEESSELEETGPSLPSMESDDVLIGSFFVKNEVEADDDNDSTTDNNNSKRNAWLITPLPCLTSITASSQQQCKSMIDNDQIENLRIEQPDKFMSASTIVEVKPISRRLSMKGKPTLRYKKTYAEATQQEDVVELKSLFDMPPSSSVVVVPMSMELVLVPTTITPTVAAVTTPIRNEKRKETMKSLSPATSTSSSLESPKKMCRKTGKSMKTTTSNTSGKKTSSHQPKANKENIAKNMQMKSLLLAECFPNENKKKRNNGRYGQIQNVNKNSALFAMAGNTRTRKFHNLQQPSITLPHPVKF